MTFDLMKMFLTQYCIIWVSTVKGYKYAVNMLNNYKYDFFFERYVSMPVS